MDTTFYFNANSKVDCYNFASRLNVLMENEVCDTQEIVYLCIGSDRSTGDSLGPLVGDRLSKMINLEGTVYGTLKNPVHAVNLSEYVENIYRMHRNPFIIAIDASLGTKRHIGYVTLNTSPLKPGLGVKKELPEIGNLSVTGIVNLSGMADSMVLQSTRLYHVMELSEYISNGIMMASHLRRKSLLKVL